MKLKYKFFGLLLFVGLFFVPRNVNAKDSEIGNKTVENIEIKNNKTAKDITLENVKKYLEKIGEEELFEKAKIEIENIYKNKKTITLKRTGGSSYGAGEHATGAIYMGNGGMISYTILDGRMRISDLYLPKDEALRVAKGGILNDKFIKNIIGLLADFGTNSENVYVKSVSYAVKYIQTLTTPYRKYILQEVESNNISVYIQTIEDNRAGGFTTHLCPWDKYPFVDVRDKDNLVILSDK